MQTVIVNVDGINLNATHFAQMSAQEGPKRIVADGITKDEAWAQKAYALCVEKVNPRPVAVPAEAPAKADARPAKPKQ